MNPKKECHERRGGASRALLGSFVLASVSLGACGGDNHGEDSAELQAILHDGELTAVMRSMLIGPTPQPGAGMSGAAGAGGRMAGPIGPSGLGGFGGSGVGGSTGAAGNGMGGPTRSFPGE